MKNVCGEVCYWIITCNEKHRVLERESGKVQCRHVRHASARVGPGTIHLTLQKAVSLPATVTAVSFWVSAMSSTRTCESMSTSFPENWKWAWREDGTLTVMEPAANLKQELVKCSQKYRSQERAGRTAVSVSQRVYSRSSASSLVAGSQHFLIPETSEELQRRQWVCRSMMTY